ncbi:MAG: hypothetical protein NTW68_04620 [candidate division NC10 bacterium]|nr:hypothetical protein [candidate division NC10 bacterium]
MTRRERILRATRGERVDRLPFFHYWRHSQFGYAERDCRNRGMGLNWDRPPYVINLHGVEITEQRAVVDGQPLFRRTYTTPLGSVYEEERREPGVGLWHGSRSWKSILPWVTSRLIKGPEDYPVVKYIVEHTEYLADYLPIEQAMDWLGEEGVVLDSLPHSPMQMLMIHWVGSEEGRIFYHMADYPELVEDLYCAVSKSREPLYEIAAGSPAPVALCGDNVDSVLANPILFRKYFMPEYEKQAAALHRRGKLMAVHMDGRLQGLKELIGQTPIDIIEALHPPPMGDLPINEALVAWPGKAIWIGFPGATYEFGPEATRQYALDLLREVGAGDRLAIAMSTEGQVSNDNLMALTDVLASAALPLDPAAIEQGIGMPRARSLQDARSGGTTC